MHRIALIFLLSLLLPDFYIYLVHIVRLTRRRWLRMLWWVPTLLLLFFFVKLMFLSGPNSMAHNGQAIARMAIAIILMAVPKIVFMLCSLLGVAIHTLIRRCPRTPFTAIGILLALISFGSVLYGSTLGISRFEINEVEYHSARIPKGFDGYRIVHFSDLHLGSWIDKQDKIIRLVELINEQEPDLIVFTGDLVNQRSDELSVFIPILNKLEARHGVWSILGNHDYGTYYHWPSPQAEQENLKNLIRMQKEMGWQMLNNEHSILCNEGDSIALIGVENDGEPPFSQHAELEKASQGTEGVFSILLSHNPTHWRREVIPQTNIDLMLAGHTHAMQVILFGQSLSELIYPEWKGMYHEGDQSLYVNIGIGYVGLPFRFGAWPEVTVITLVNDKEQLE